ncbi:ribosomal protein S8 [Hypoxylon fragiforme]|uniref:ribosomal protein S8 n=1 Tax=Hypoxylon fragiforme TaxID=63214 RepID=UPI0020C5D385|nr:ribosomal protein S8 [Hypoxylon fragiforme]KAI2604124.1 ribosomal protein S8 [Hypoxylon fragiforme]
MGISNCVNFCSHLTNASRARLGMTSFPHTKYNVQVALALQRTGFLSFVTRGGTHPPNPETIATYEPPPLTTANVAKQRLWVGLKYSVNNGGEPVLTKLTPLSTSKRPVTAKLPVLEKLARGFDAQRHRGLTFGECLIVNTSEGTLEVREAIQKRLGGLLLCRVS